MKTIVVERFDTVLSDLGSLYAESIIRTSEVVMTVQDHDGHRYEIRFELPGPSRIVDEDGLVSYWSSAKPNLGWTRVVEDPSWTDDLELGDEGYTCYMICTWDICLEILSWSPPKIRSLSD